MATFEELGLGSRVMSAVRQLGYTEPTPVQEQAIPLVLEGSDVIAGAQTGTGKTAAFILPILDKLGHYRRGQGPLCLIVTPTRELAQQIDSVARTVAKKTGHFVLTVVGGVSYNPQINGLRRGIDVLVATPGRLLDLYDRGVLDLSHVKVLVLDEGDRMLDMGFWPDVKKIIDLLPEERQTLLFSATIDDSVMQTIGGEIHDPTFVEIAHRGTAAETVEQFVIPVAQGQKTDLLEYLLDEKGAERVIVFTRTKERAEVLAERLNREGFRAEAIHGDRSQNQRSRALRNFREGRTGVIVATDVLSRGIDVTDVDYVINYDIPLDAEDYIHRIGRTGRAGEAGSSITFVTVNELDELAAIEYLMKKTITEMEPEGFDFNERRPALDPDRDPTVAPRRKGGRNRGRSRQGGRSARGSERSGGRDERSGGNRAGSRDERHYEGGRDRHSGSDNFDRVKRQEYHNEKVAREEAVLTGEAAETSREHSGYRERENRGYGQRRAGNGSGQDRAAQTSSKNASSGSNNRSGSSKGGSSKGGSSKSGSSKSGSSKSGGKKSVYAKGGTPKQYGVTRRPGDHGGNVR